MTPSDLPNAVPRKEASRWLRAQRQIAARPLLVAGALAATGSILAVPLAWMLAHAIAAVVILGTSLDAVLGWLWPLPLVLLARFALMVAADRLALIAGARIKASIREALVARLQALGPAFVQTRATGDLAATVIDSVDALEPYFTRYVVHMTTVSILPLVILAVVLPRDWISGLVLLVTAPVIPLFMILIGYGTERLNRRQWQRLARLGGQLLDALQRLTSLKILNASRREADLLSRAVEDYRRSTMSVLRVAFLSSLMLEFFATVGIAVVAVLIGFRLLDGVLGFEAGFFVLLLAPEFYAPLRQLGADYHARMDAIGAAERIVEILDIDPPASGNDRPDLGDHIDLALESVEFQYAKDTPVLHSISVGLEARKITALVCPSGAGKSTLLALLLGIRRPTGGRILANQHDLSSLAPDHWLHHVALVPQRPHMFAGTVADNIRMGNPNVSLAAIQAAARLAEADRFIEKRPLGYDTPLGERGHTLSGGEVQRLALARAFLKDAPVVFMDEATTGLDRESEALVTMAIRRLAAGRLVLIIAHRLQTVRLADRILVMAAGRIVEQGTHEALSQGDTQYAALLRDARLPP